MSPRRQLLAFGSLLLGLMFAQPVFGQYSEVRFGRPTAQSPSNRVGRTGGIGTRDTGVSARQTALGGRRRAGGDPGIVRLPARQELQRGSRLPPNLMPAAFLLGTPGFAFEGRRRSPFRLTDTSDLARLGRVSGFTRTLQHRRPLLPREPVYPVMSKGPYYAVAPNQDGFGGFFNLSPGPTDESDPEATPTEPILTYGELLERENAAHLQRTKDRAVAAFKKGTSPRQENRSEHLSQAADLLAQIMRTDSTDPIPALLAVHTALEKENVAVAERALLDLVMRDPEIFLRDSGVEKYFGDARTLENQMRRFWRAGENTKDPSAWALQAYCNWVLGDATRTQLAVQQMQKANRQGRGSRQVRVFGYALSAALSAAND